MAKKKPDLSARKSAIKSLKSEMRGDGLGPLADKLKGKMTVKVMADTPEELKEGLEKAEEILEMGEEGEGDFKSMLKDAFAMRSKKVKKEED